jgi:hypothetical protein
MKLTDILIPEQSLIDLVESLGYIPEDLKWEGDIGIFSVNGETFEATVTPSTKKDEETFKYFFNPIPKVGNVDFSMITETGSTQDTTKKMRSSAFKVFGGVAFIVSELVKRYGYEVLLCVAKQKQSPTNYSSRVSAYESIVQTAARNVGMRSMKLFETPDSTGYVIFKHKLYTGMIAVRDHLNNYYNTNI